MKAPYLQDYAACGPGWAGRGRGVGGGEKGAGCAGRPGKGGGEVEWTATWTATWTADVQTRAGGFESINRNSGVRGSLIVDLHLNGRLVVVVGGGSEGLKKINSLLTQDCRILLVSDRTNAQIDGYVREKRIRFERAALTDADILSRYDPYVVMATTDDRELNRRIARKAKEMGCLSYASDDPEASDFAHPSVINIGDAVQVAVSTGGQSPIMAKRIRIEAEKVLKGVVTEEDVAQIKLQRIARERARGLIPTQRERRRFLYAVLGDGAVRESIRAGDFDGARARMDGMLGEWGG